MSRIVDLNGRSEYVATCSPKERRETQQLVPRHAFVTPWSFCAVPEHIYSNEEAPTVYMKTSTTLSSVGIPVRFNQPLQCFQEHNAHEVFGWNGRDVWLRPENGLQAETNKELGRPGGLQQLQLAQFFCFIFSPSGWVLLAEKHLCRLEDVTNRSCWNLESQPKPKASEALAVMFGY